MIILRLHLYNITPIAFLASKKIKKVDKDLLRSFFFFLLACDGSNQIHNQSGRSERSEVGQTLGTSSGETGISSGSARAALLAVILEFLVSTTALLFLWSGKSTLEAKDAGLSFSTGS